MNFYTVKPEFARHFRIDQDWVVETFMRVNEQWWTMSGNSLNGMRAAASVLLRDYLAGANVDVAGWRDVSSQQYVIDKFEEFASEVFCEVGIEPEKLLKWVDRTETWRDAALLNPDGTVGVQFTLTYQASCQRRGRWKLLIEVAAGKWHHAWGCFDEQDQPMRLYHNTSAALLEAETLADVLTKGFTKEREHAGDTDDV